MPFPHVESDVREMRPALVITARPVGPEPTLFWALMLTGAGNRAWPGDVIVPDHAACGLPIPCRIRTAKVAVFETRIASLVGVLDAATLDLVDAELKRQLALG